jgi:hypothetical protein
MGNIIEYFAFIFGHSGRNSVFFEASVVIRSSPARSAERIMCMRCNGTIEGSPVDFLFLLSVT